MTFLDKEKEIKDYLKNENINGYVFEEIAIYINDDQLLINTELLFYCNYELEYFRLKKEELKKISDFMEFLESLGVKEGE